MGDFFDNLEFDNLEDWEDKNDAWECSSPVLISGWTSSQNNICSLVHAQGIQNECLHVEPNPDKKKSDCFFLLAVNLKEKIHDDFLLLRLLYKLLYEVAKYLNVALVYCENDEIRVYKKWHLDIETIRFLKPELCVSSEHFKAEIQNDEILVTNGFISKVRRAHELHINNITEIPAQVKNSLVDSCFFEHALRNDDIYFILTQRPGEKIHLPIFIRNEKITYSDLWSSIRNKRDEFVPSNPVLGYFATKEERFDGQECRGPHIVLCSDNINKFAEEIGISIDLLYKIVIVHELAHAMMSKNRTNPFSDFEAQAMEESLANEITLEFFYKHDNANFIKVHEFIEFHQPAIYQFGIRQFNVGANWTKWRDSDKNMPTLKDWFDKCFSEGKIRDNLNYTIEDFNRVFE